MTLSSYVLFDLPSKDGSETSWSPNAWKTRFLLNFLGIEYNTEWVEYPGIEARLKDHVEPNEQGPAYTIPAIQKPDGTYLMDSQKIAEYLQSQSPDTLLHLDSIYIKELEALFEEAQTALFPIFVSKVATVLLNETSAEYYRRTREALVGMSLDQFEEKNGGEETWEKVEHFLGRVGKLLLREKEGPYFMGSTPSYADFVWGGILLFIDRLNLENWEKALDRSEDPQVHKDLLEALQKWV